MILSDAGIRDALSSGAIVIEPPPQPEQYQTSAVDIRLGKQFLVWNLDLLTSTPGFKAELDLSQQRFGITAKQFARPAQLESDGAFVLPPYSQVPRVLLCQTLEKIELKPDSCLAARVEGRSSLARLGVMVHLTAPTIHAGFTGNITLEVINHGPFFLRLVPEATRMCQFIFERLESPPAGLIGTQFQGQTTPVGKA